MKLPCSIVREVLPNYVDECISEEAKELVEEHIQECEDCKTVLVGMKQELEQPVESVDFLKKVKTRNRKRVCLAVLVTLLLCTSMLIAKIYLVGSIASTNNLTFMDVKVASGKVSGLVRIDGTGEVIKSISISKPDHMNMQSIDMKTVKSSLFYSESVQPFEISLKDIDHFLYLGNQVVDRNGNIYDRLAFDLIDQRIPYVGDMGGVHTILSLLNFDQFGYCSLALSTEEEPYSIYLIYQNELTENQLDHIKDLSKLALGCIDNCNIIIIKSKGKDVLTVESSDKIKTYEDMVKQFKGIIPERSKYN